MEELELRITDLTDRCRGLIETHRVEMEEEREKRKKDLADTTEEHREAIQVIVAAGDRRVRKSRITLLVYLQARRKVK